MMSMDWMPAFSAETNPLLRLSLALLLASLAGEAAARFLRLPRITGYSLIGLLIGASGLGWFTAEDLDGWRVVINLALALLLFEMGMRVDLQWFRANRMLLASSVAEAILSFLTVYAVMRMLDAAVPLSAAVAAIAMATSPAVVMRVAAELRANGQVTNRLIVLAALNVIYSAVALNLIIGGLHGVEGRGWGAVILHPLYLIVGPVLVAIGLAFAFRWLRRHFDFSDEEGAAVLLGLLLLSVAILDSANLPVVLAPLLAGIIVKNTDRRPHLWPRHFGTAGGLLVILLFVLTGVSLTWNQIIAGGLAALALILARFLGKAVGVIALGPASGLSWRQSAALAMALLPMSGVAFVLVLDFRAIFPAQGDALAAIVFSMVAILELAGPIAVQFALRLTGEARGRKA